MLRVGEIVKQDDNPLMNVSTSYEETVGQLADFDYPDEKTRLLACLVISQTEKQYKKYLIRVLQGLERLPLKELVDNWQQADFEVDDKTFQDLLTQDEYRLVQPLDLEDHLENDEGYHPELFKDCLSLAFYPTKKKGTLYLRRLIGFYLSKFDRLDPYRQLLLCFTAAQLLVSWESSCLHLSKMLLENWEIAKMAEWFCQTWPIYEE